MFAVVEAEVVMIVLVVVMGEVRRRMVIEVAMVHEYVDVFDTMVLV